MKKILAIIGPTASGKTFLSIELAKKLNAEIISADSRQVYKYMNIATAAPTKDEMQGIKHYFVNEFEPDINFTAGQFAKISRNLINDIFSKNKNVIITGGSGLYLNALIYGIFESSELPSEIREKLIQRLEKEGNLSLYNELIDIDPVLANKMDPTKTRRIIRALEIYYGTGMLMSEFQKKITPPEFNTIQIGLLWDREILYKRINDRVDNMIKIGLLEEIKNLIDKGYHYKTQNSLNTVGVKEVIKYFEYEYSLDEMILYIKQNTRRYAKKQTTWFRKNTDILWLEGEKDYNTLIENIIRIYIK